MANKKAKCETIGCQDDVKYPRLGLCGACYSYYRFWRDRPAGDVLKRKRQVERFSVRLDNIQPWLKVFKDRSKERQRKIKSKIRLVKANVTRKTG
jgi:hypothetical protein